MTNEEALAIISKQLADYKATSDNFETVFPGAVSAYRQLVEAYTIAEFALKKLIEESGEEESPDA